MNLHATSNAEEAGAQRRLNRTRVPGMFGADLAPLLIAAAATAPLGPMVALFLAAFAANKVQGFAFTKVSGVLLLPPLAACFAAAKVPTA